MHPDIRILAEGDWPRGQLHTRWTTSTHHVPDELRTQVDAAWNHALSRPGVHLFDGGMCRMESFTADERGLTVTLSATSYKQFIGTNGSHGEWADVHGWAILANPLGTSVALESGDGHLIFGKRSATMALYPGFAHPFGGTLELPGNTGEVDLIAEIQREIHEEIGLAPADFDNVRAVALIEDRTLRQPELVFIAHSPWPREHIIASLDTHEHDACWTIPADVGAVADALNSAMPMTPVLRAALAAWMAWMATQR